MTRKSRLLNGVTTVPLPFYTVGHSTRTLEEFLDVLRAAEVTFVVDVRSIPRSRTNPQYNKDTLSGKLASSHVGYELVPELGGRRNKSKEIPAELNAFWSNQSFHNYADYALSESFRVGLERLIALGRLQRCTMMCSEAVWWRCHRRIVTDHLIARGETVFHLMSKNKIEPAQLTKGARVEDDTMVIYPKEEQ